jgi:hypothetical protein
MSGPSCGDGAGSCGAAGLHRAGGGPALRGGGAGPCGRRACTARRRGGTVRAAGLHCGAAGLHRAGGGHAGRRAAVMIGHMADTSETAASLRVARVTALSSEDRLHLLTYLLAKYPDSFSGMLDEALSTISPGSAPSGGEG